MVVTQLAEKINCNSASVAEFSDTACTRCYSVFAFKIWEEIVYGCSVRTRNCYHSLISTASKLQQYVVTLISYHCLKEISAFTYSHTLEHPHKPAQRYSVSCQNRKIRFLKFKIWYKMFKDRSAVNMEVLQKVHGKV